MSIVRSLRTGCLVTGAAMGALGCQSESPERPPPLDTGETASTGPRPGGGQDQGGQDGEGGQGQPHDEEQLEGRVERFTAADFLQKEGYSEPSQVLIIDRDDRDVFEVEYDGVAFFVDAAKASQWLAVVPEFDPTHVDSITLWDGQGPPRPAVVPRAVLDEIAGGLIAADTINPSRAQLLLQVVERDGVTGVAGVSSTVVGAPDLAFYDGGVWSDVDTITGESGLIFAYNIAAPDLPGQTVRVILSGTVETEFTVLLAAGASTFFTYTVE